MRYNFASIQEQMFDKGNDLFRRKKVKGRGHQRDITTFGNEIKSVWGGKEKEDKSFDTGEGKLFGCVYRGH